MKQKKSNVEHIRFFYKFCLRFYWVKFKTRMEGMSKRCVFCISNYCYLSLWQQYHMETEYQITLIIYKNIWINFTLKKLDFVCFCSTCIFIHYQCYIDRGAIERGTFFTPSLNMQNKVLKKLLYHVYYGTLPKICWYLWYIFVWPRQMLDIVRNGYMKLVCISNSSWSL